MRLLCDEMLAGLVRWLRAAGHDAALAEAGSPDAEVLAAAKAESRCLLTRDRTLAERAAGRALFLTEDDMDAQAAQIASVLGLDWTLAPFSRCVLDNTALRRASEEEVAKAPADARDAPVWTCPTCHRLYWSGSHVRRMTERLEGWKVLSREDAAKGTTPTSAPPPRS